ncbi:hypothetical protein HW450_06190 [Corynebacterium hindlerae]|uniref:Oxidoreductase n=1 Tax=Corynebacterium hindlerae TaxID=699041 RepID=A0A7G5FI50_9CORY|nr:hypothetical protein [Corynebacterium hindlerae]QMV86291.1 hypothetical protein HW450_06190 [Corynebacterium hindlerae]
MSLVSPELFTAATETIAAVHRRPVSLRRSAVTSSEAVLRGARLSALIDAIPAETAIDVASVLAPDAVEGTARTFLRAPLQVLARMDVLAGGDGKPTDNVVALQQLAQVIVTGHEFLPGVVHGVVLGCQPFGARSGVIARAASRLAAVATGFDPRGLTVPEVYLHRHARAYQELDFLSDPKQFCDFQLRAFIAGATEAESIARQA